MNGLYYINMTMEIINGVICLILLLCVSTAEYRKEKLNRVFIYLVSLTLTLILVDIIIFTLEGKTGNYIGIVFRTAYFFSFILGSILLIIFTRYLLAFIKTVTAVSKTAVIISYAAIVICGLNIAFVIFTQLTGFYYSIDSASNFFHGSGYILSQIFAATCILLNTVIIVNHRKSFEIREMVFLFSYAALPMFSLLIQNAVEGAIASIDTATTLTLLVFYAGIQSEQAKRLKQKELELSESRIAIMLSQIHPHFLYNSLTAIGEVCDTDPARAKAAVTDFAHYLRGNLESLTKRKLIPFEDELDHVETYLSMEHLRFSDKLQVQYDILTDDFMLPPLTVQPIVENAVQHGLMEKDRGGTLCVRTEEIDEAVRITVFDDGVGFDVNGKWKMENGKLNDKCSHIGIENVRNRLHAMCGGSLDIQSVPGKGTTAIITIPKIEN